LEWRGCPGRGVFVQRQKGQSSNDHDPHLPPLHSLSLYATLPHGSYFSFHTPASTPPRCRCQTRARRVSPSLAHPLAMPHCLSSSAFAPCSRYARVQQLSRSVLSRSRHGP
jgi:hypothetical protein